MSSWFLLVATCPYRAREIPALLIQQCQESARSHVQADITN
ncbi:hypothetical protein SF123566_3433 [Shigella flexneri 1235-66]|nr:hypothetical protein SF123566_3433 [Shigella flexneri 1235-66]